MLHSPRGLVGAELTVSLSSKSMVWDANEEAVLNFRGPCFEEPCEFSRLQSGLTYEEPVLEKIERYVFPDSNGRRMGRQAQMIAVPDSAMAKRTDVAWSSICRSVS